MPKIYNKNFTKAELIRRVGNMKSIAAINRIICNEGKEDGVKTIEITNGVLSATLLESRALDISSLKYKGIPLSFLGKNGVVSAALADPVTAPLRSVTGGMFYTCGLTNVGSAFSDGDYFHGRMRLIPAQNVSIDTSWTDNDYVLTVKGEMWQNGVLCENLRLARTITTKLGSKTIKIMDTVTNEGFTTSPLMLMYHIVTGFPLLDDTSELTIPAKEQAQEDAYYSAAPADDGAGSGSYFHNMLSDENGYGYCSVYNPSLQLGLIIKFNINNLPYLSQWKSMQSGDYAMGIMPTNCFAAGRQTEIDRKTLHTIEPEEKFYYEVSFTVIDSEDEYKAFLSTLKNLK